MPRRLAALLLLVVLTASLPAQAHLAALRASAPAALSTAPAPAPSPSMPLAPKDSSTAGRATGVRVGPAPPPVILNTGMDDDAPSAMQFTCPTGSATSVPNTDPTDRTVYGCPIRVYDTDHPFGNPQIAVRADDPSQVAFFSLHGGASTKGPHGYSRVDQTHVTFTSDNQGVTWSDQPTGYPKRGGRDYFGETASGAFDRNGNLYVGYLWSQTRGEGSYGSHIGLFKASGPSDPGGVLDSYQDGAFLDGRTTINPIPALWLVDVPGHVDPPMMDNSTNATGNGTAVAPGKDGDVVLPMPANATDERIVAVWHESAPDWRNSTTGLSGWIEAAFTDTGPRDHWARMTDHQLIGPCKDSSNPVAYNGAVYVACVVDAGYKARPRAHVGDIDIWRIDPLTGNTSFVDRTGLRTGHPMLAAAPNGYMALAASTPMLDNVTGIRVAFSWFGRDWTQHKSYGADLGPEMHRLAGSRAAVGGTVTALALANDEKTAMLIYKERQVPTSTNDVPAVDPQNPPDPTKLTDVRLTEYRKVVISFNECDAPIAAAAFTLGTGLDAYQLKNYQDNAATYDDVQDGLQVVRDASGKELFYFAVDDYGAMQFGAIEATGVGGFCAVPPPIATLPVPPVPQALSVANGASLVVGAGVGVTSLAMVTYLLAAKKKSALHVTTKDK